MIDKIFENITQEDVDYLVNNKVMESKTIEYKRELPGESDKEKKSFLATVSSFANASGGDIVYGITEADEEGEKKGEPTAVSPINVLERRSDDEIRRLESMIQSGIQPRLDVKIRAITGWEHENNYVLIIRVPKSFRSPHRVVYKNYNRFYVRGSAGKQELDVDGLRDAFLATESQAVRVKEFIEDRISKIFADETPVVLKNKTRLTLHVIPMRSFLNRERYKFDESEIWPTLITHVGAFTLGMTNLDGKYFYTGEYNSAGSYVMQFFSGVIECVESEIIMEENGKLAIGSFESHIIKQLESVFSFYKREIIDCPIVVCLGLLGCKNYSAYRLHKADLPMFQIPQVDRSVAVMPMVILESYDNDLHRAMKPVFDSLWNTCGYQGSNKYDESGDWIVN